MELFTAPSVIPLSEKRRMIRFPVERVPNTFEQATLHKCSHRRTDSSLGILTEAFDSKASFTRQWSGSPSWEPRTACITLPILGEVLSSAVPIGVVEDRPSMEFTVQRDSWTNTVSLSCHRPKRLRISTKA